VIYFSIFLPMKNKIRTWTIFLSVFVSLAFLEESCVSHEFPSYTCSSEPVSFTTDITTIIETRCALSGCHNGDGNPDGPGADKNWNDFSLFQENARNGLVRTYVLNRIMPPSSAEPLTQEQINDIACWIDQGAEDN
jgi:hypothetical protein